MSGRAVHFGRHITVGSQSANAGSGVIVRVSLGVVGSAIVCVLLSVLMFALFIPGMGLATLVRRQHAVGRLVILLITSRTADRRPV